MDVALTKGLAGKIHGLIEPAADDRKDGKPDTAIFYSISNCQEGLAGISFGNFLIKQVADAVQSELPDIRQFATLSPVPGFRKWLDDVLVRSTPDYLNEDEIDLLHRSDWRHNQLIREPLKPALMRLCARYLIEENTISARSIPSPGFISAMARAWSASTGRLIYLKKASTNPPV